MREIRKSTATAMVGLGVLVLLTSPSLGASSSDLSAGGASLHPAHMGQGEGQGRAGQSMTIPQGMMLPCMAPEGTMGSGMMGPGMMGPGMMGPGMMGFGAGDPGMMRPGFGGPPWLGHRVVQIKDLTTDDVRHFFEHRLEMHGNKRLKIGDVKESDEDKIVADIVTTDDSLVERLEVDRHTGEVRPVE